MLQRGIVTKSLSKPFPWSRHIKWIISEISYTSNNLFLNKMAVLQIYIELQPTLSIDVLFCCLWAISPFKMDTCRFCLLFWMKGPASLHKTTTPYSNLSKPWKGASAHQHHLQYKVTALWSTSERGFRSQRWHWIWMIYMSSNQGKCSNIWIFFFTFWLDNYATRPVRAGGWMWNYKAKLNKTNGQIIREAGEYFEFSVYI